MRILVAFASRHGGTEGIADAIATTLRETETTAGSGGAEDAVSPDAHHLVDVLSVGDVEDVTGYDAVIVGSAVYVGRWMDSARRFVLNQVSILQNRPVWLFSSGPVGDPAVPDTEAADAAELAELVEAQGTRTFAGRLRPAELSLSERARIRDVHAAEGDYRDWAEIREWALDIASTLAAATLPIRRASEPSPSRG